MRIWLMLILFCALIRFTAFGQDMAATYISAAEKLEAAAAQTSDPQQRASYLQQAKQHRNMASQLGTANSSSPSAYSSPDGSTAALDSLARQQAQLRQLQQQQQEAQQRLQAINAANQKIQNLNNARDSVNGAIGTLGNMMNQQMQQHETDEEQRQQQLKEERLEREQQAIQKQIDEQQKEIEAFQNRQPINFDDQSAPVPASGAFSSLLDTPDTPQANLISTSVSQHDDPAPNEISSIASSLFENDRPSNPQGMTAQTVQQQSAGRRPFARRSGGQHGSNGSGRFTV
jgi:hypothetical protein